MIKKLVIVFAICMLAFVHPLSQVYVSVKDIDGNKLQGAEVWTTAHGKLLKKTTKFSGRVYFSTLSHSKEYKFEVKANGYKLQSKMVTTKEDSTQNIIFRLELE